MVDPLSIVSAQTMSSQWFPYCFAYAYMAMTFTIFDSICIIFKVYRSNVCILNASKNATYRVQPYSIFNAILSYSNKIKA